MAIRNWVETVFCKRECIKFIPSNRDNGRCCCGQLWQFHNDGSPATLRTQETQELHWSPTRHTQLLPTDAYGTIEFQGGPHPTKAQYIRLSHDTCPSLILELLSREWGLGLPKLLITIQGGKTNFELQPKLKKVIRKGLLKAAKTTGAWVFTAGTNAGVTRHAGDALAVETTVRDRGGSVVSVGIVPWGIIERKNELIGRNKDVPYHPVISSKTRYATLNCHHRYFLLVDNGTAGKYGPEIVLRRKLENYISHQRIETRGGLVTPVVCVVIEGGPQTIRQVLEYVTDSPPVPVIVCDGTGRAADILAFVHKYAVSGPTVLENNRATIVHKLESVFELRTEQAEKLFIELLQCTKKTDLITVFRLKEDSELDQSILSALLQLKRLNPPEQLSLALTWNRVDIARSHVFNEYVEWPPGSLEQAMMDALVNDRIEFVKLLLEQGVSMSKFLTTLRLEDLYNSKQGPSNTLQYVIRDGRKNVSKDYKFSLVDIGLAINKLMGGAFRSSYTRKKFRTYYTCLKSSAITNGSLFNLNMTSLPKSSGLGNRRGSQAHCTFEYPFSELLMWAVLTKRQGLAMLMWQHGEEAVAKALVAAKLYKALAHEAADDDLEAEIYEELRNYAKEFEVLALEVLDYCYQQDEDKAHQVLTYELKNWSKQTCLSLAVAVNHRALLSHPCCQILLADLWLGGLRTRKNTNIKVLMSLLLPPFVALLGFRSREELRSMPQTVEEHREEEQYRYSDSESDTNFEEDHLDMKIDGDLEIGKGGRMSVSTAPTAAPMLPSLQSYLMPLFNSSHPSVACVGDSRRGFVGRWRKQNIVTIQESSDMLQHMSNRDATFTDKNSIELPSRIKFYEFYNAPITKFWAHSIAFLLFLCLFTYSVLVKLPQWPQWNEWYVLAYIFTLLLEKLREILSSEPVQLKQKLEVWSNKLWNVFDLFFTSFFLFGFCFRMQTGNLRDVGRLIYCVDIIYWYLKVLEILSANKYLGPLVMMMGKMIKNMAYFVILLLVVLMAFGVCRQSVLYPNEEPDWKLAKQIFYQPYFMLYGEVFADEIDPPCGGEGQGECQPGRWITPAVMSMYLLVANILLINLLIAVFNNIFTSVNAISHQVWMFQRFQVVMEYEEKPVFPPPLIIFSHIHRVIKYSRRRWKAKPCIYDHGLKLFLDGENLERLHDFEEECVDSYMREKEQKVQMSTEERVRLMAEKTEYLTQRLEDMHSKFIGTISSINNVEFQLKNLQEEVQHTKNSYAVVHRFMLRHVRRRQRKSSGSKSDTITPSSMPGSPRSSFSQTSLCQMLEETQKYMLRNQSVDEEGDDESDSSEDDAKIGKGQETGRGKHGARDCNRGDRKAKASKTNMSKKSDEYTAEESDAHRRRRHSGRRDKEGKGPEVKSRKSSFKSSGGTFSEDGQQLFNPSRVCFKGYPNDVTETESDMAEEQPLLFPRDRKNFRRSLSECPDERKSPPKYDRSVSAASSRPSIQIIPPSSPPPIITFTSEYTSIGDELETVMSRLTPHGVPSIQMPQHRIRQRFYSESSSSYGIQICEYHDLLRDSEEADYYLMEGIIQKRMHRNSQNLAVSLEELCSIVSDASDNEEEEEKHSKSLKVLPRTTELRKRHSTSSLEFLGNDFLSISGPPRMSNLRQTMAYSSAVAPVTPLLSMQRRASSVYSCPLPNSSFVDVRPSRSPSPHSLQVPIPSPSPQPTPTEENDDENSMKRLQIPSLYETEAMPSRQGAKETKF